MSDKTPITELEEWWKEVTDEFRSLDLDAGDIMVHPLKDQPFMVSLNGEMGAIVREIGNRWGAVAIQISVMGRNHVNLLDFIVQQTGLAEEEVKDYLRP